MSQGDFDYDILTYDVLDRVAYSDYSTPYYTSGYYGSCFSCGYRPYRSGLSIGLFFGRPYRRSYYDPFYSAYDPFYDPFFYDPYYYPAYYRPFYPRSYYPSYFPRDRFYGYYNTPGRRYAAPYTPYRFRGNDAVLTGYRGRGFTGARAVNTVYIPPRSRVIQPVATSPGRRADRARADVGSAGGGSRRAARWAASGQPAGGARSAESVRGSGASRAPGARSRGSALRRIGRSPQRHAQRPPGKLAAGREPAP